MTSTDSISLPDYDGVAAAMQRCGMPQCPAELHGFALGMAVAGVREPLSIWQREVYAEFDSDNVLDNEARKLLDQVFAATSTFTADTPASLNLLLPGDIVVDSRRVAALRDWCQGFLFGFGLAGDGVDALLSSQTRELLGDFTEFTRLDTENVDNSEQNQAALIEIEEYVREGVLLIGDELGALRRAPATQHE